MSFKSSTLHTGAITNMQEEIWKVYPRIEWVMVSSLGNVKTLDRRVITKRGYVNYKGMNRIPTNGGNKKTLTKYLKVAFGSKSYWLHILVAETFISNPCNKLQVNHIDGNGLNNCISNLEWVTQSENIRHSTDILKHVGTNIEGKTLKQHAKDLGAVGSAMVSKRIIKGWCQMCAITIPVNKSKKYVYCTHR